MFVPLSYGEDGTSFEVPENEDGSGPAGWLVLRKTSEGRGRPAVVHHRNGKPLIVPLDATHEDLLRFAGKGRYRLQVVDQYGRKLDGVPAAHTGMLTAYPVEGDDSFDLDQEEEGDDSSAASMSMSAGRRPSSIESVLIHTVTANTQVMQQMASQFVPVMQAVTQIMETCANVGLFDRAALAAAEPEAPAPAPAPNDSATLLKTALDAILPVINQIAMGIAMKGTSASSPPPSPQPAPVPMAPPPPMPPRPGYRGPTESTSRPMPAASRSEAHETPAGAIPTKSPGMAPAESALELQMRAGQQLQMVLASLNPQEQAQAVQLVTELDDEARASLLVELVQLTVEQAVDRARALLAIRASTARVPSSPGKPPSSTPGT